MRAQTKIMVIVDTARVKGGGGLEGIYMIDNRLEYGSTNEGNNELHTQCPKGDIIGWSVLPMNPVLGDTVKINGFQQSGGDRIFGINTPQYNEDKTTCKWQTEEVGTATYQIKILINGIDYHWDPFITTK